MLIYFAIISQQSNTKNTFPGLEASVHRLEYYSKIILYWWRCFKIGVDVRLWHEADQSPLLAPENLASTRCARLSMFRITFALVNYVFCTDLVTTNNENAVGPWVVPSSAMTCCSLGMNSQSQVAWCKKSGWFPTAEG